jgi:hypothetical protein
LYFYSLEGKFGSSIIGNISIFIGGFFLLILISLIFRFKIIFPPMSAYALAAKSIFQPFYWYNQNGIWKNNKLIIKWEEIKDLEVLEVKPVVIRRARAYRVFPPILNGKRTSYITGSVRFFKEDGGSFDMKGVFDPERTVEHIKNNYLIK